jgi:hypothetical protein
MISWTALALNCLCCVLAIISTATCSFLVDKGSAYYDQVDYGLFCFRGDGVKVGLALVVED